MTRDPDREPCPHPQYRCLQCGNTGCADPGCASQGFEEMMCRSCGHIERVGR